MNKKRLRGNALFLTLLGCSALCFTACDESYDLSKDINTDLNVGGSLSIPLGTSEELKLSRIIELNEDIKVDENGAYAIEQSGNIGVDVPSISKIIIKNISADPNVVNIDADPQSSVPVDYHVNSSLDYIMRVNATEDVPTEVKHLDAILFNPVISTLSIKLDFDDPSVLSRTSNVAFDNFYIELPEILVFDKTQVAGLGEGNRLKLDGHTLDSEGELNIDLPLIGIINLPEVDLESHTITFADKMNCKGNFLADCKAVTTEDLASMTLTTSFTIPEISVDRIRGTFNPDIEVNAETISFGNLPDVLMDENTEISINHIATTMEIENPVGIPFSTHFAFTALDKNGNPINEQVDLTIRVPEATDYTVSSQTKYYISNMDVTPPSGYKLIVVPELTKLIKRIPNQIRIHPTVEIDENKEHFIQLEDPRTTQASYNVAMPFDLGKNSRLRYVEIVDDLQSDLADFSDKISEISVNAEITSTIPLQLRLNAVPYDYNGNDISQLVEISEIAIEAGSEGTPAQQQTILLKETDKGKGSLKNLDRIDLTINADTKDAGSAILKPSQYVIVKLKANIPNGINIEL